VRPEAVREDFESASLFLTVALGARAHASRLLRVLDALAPAVDASERHAPAAVIPDPDPGMLTILGAVALACKVLETTERLAEGAPQEAPEGAPVRTEDTRTPWSPRELLR
jgi:hypothetical protein